MKLGRSFFFQIFAAMMASPRLSASEKKSEARSINRRSGGILFSSGSHMPFDLPNQRQRRKLNRQTKNF